MPTCARHCWLSDSLESRVTLSLAVHWQFWILDPGPGPEPPQNPIKNGRNQAPWARGELGFSLGVSRTWSPDRQAEVGDHFGHPSGAQVKGLNSEF